MLGDLLRHETPSNSRVRRNIQHELEVPRFGRVTSRLILHKLDQPHTDRLILINAHGYFSNYKQRFFALKLPFPLFISFMEKFGEKWNCFFIQIVVNYNFRITPVKFFMKLERIFICVRRTLQDLIVQFDQLGIVLVQDSDALSFQL